LIGEVHEQDIHSHGFSPWDVRIPARSVRYRPLKVASGSDKRQW
jgi:hypothetical protein